VDTPKDGHLTPCPFPCPLPTHGRTSHPHATDVTIWVEAKRPTSITWLIWLVQTKLKFPAGKIWHPPAFIYGNKSNPSADEYEIRMIMFANNIVLWEVTPRCMAQNYRRFGVTYLQPISTRLHVVTSEETVLFSHSTGSLFDIRHSEDRASWCILIICDVIWYI